MRTLSLGAFVMTVATAGACLDCEARAGEPDTLWRALQDQPVKGEAIVGWAPAAASRAEAPPEVGALRALAGVTVVGPVRTVCARTLQCDPDRQCGSIPDGCGGLLSCGRCLPGEFCDDGVCVCNGGLCL
jgi:hypothetical protein